MQKNQRNPRENYRPFGDLPVRIGTAGKKNNTIDYTLLQEKIRSDEKDLLSNMTGVQRERIIMLNQLHGSTIVDIDVPPETDTLFYADADGMITPLADLCLVIRTADCVPVFLYDRRQTLLGAAHSGWRGCRQNIAGALVAAMKNRYNSRSDDLLAYILPSIGPDAYTVNTDVASCFPKNVRKADGRIHLDLWSSVRHSLQESGIAENRIFLAGRCTSLENEYYFSHRKGDLGRNLNFGYILPPL